MKRWIGVAILGAIASLVAACGSGGSGSTSGGSGCTPGAQQACACPGGTQGVQVCADDGRSFKPCECGSVSTTTSGTGGSGVGGFTGSTGTQMGTCGDGIQQPGECNPGEFYCAADCGGAGGAGGGTTTTTTSSGAGGACQGVVIYAGKVDAVGSVWASGHGVPKMAPPGGKTGVDAGNAMCDQMAAGSHACIYEELVMAANEAGFKAIPQNTTAWVHRTKAVDVGGQTLQVAKGARCDDWTYATDHLNDGEWAEFKAQGVPTYHFDNDPNAIQANPKDAPCGHNDLDRSILCCYPCP
ncbi:MAG: hypothetical protein U0359_17020 [Byssovorax sp.]